MEWNEMKCGAPISIPISIYIGIRAARMMMDERAHADVYILAPLFRETYRSIGCNNYPRIRGIDYGWIESRRGQRLEVVPISAACGEHYK